MSDQQQPTAALARRKATTDVVFGAMLVVAGIFLFANHLSIFDVFDLWPLVIVGVGIAKIVGACCARARRSGVFVLLVGSWLALGHFTSLGYHDTWPLLLVVVGAMVAWNAAVPREPCPACSDAKVRIATGEEVRHER